MKKSANFIRISALAGMLFVNQASPILAQVSNQDATTSPVPASIDAPVPSQLQMTAIPPRLGEDFSLKSIPGQTIQTSVRVKNSSNQTMTFKSTVEDFIIGDDGKEPIPVKEETPTQWSLAKWMTITPPINTLRPNESATINVLIEVPPDALPGGRYAMIMHEPEIANGLGGGSASGITQRVGTLVYFMVEGEIHEEAYIRDVKAKSFFENGPVPFSFIIENRSDIHVRPKVEVDIKNMLGQTVSSLPLDPENIFPYTERQYASQWDNKWGFGKYTATITASYGTQGKVVTSLFSFWMIPVRLILGVLFGLISLITLIIFAKKKVSKHTVETKKEIETLKEKVKDLETEKTHSFKDDNN